MEKLKIFAIILSLFYDYLKLGGYSFRFNLNMEQDIFNKVCKYILVNGVNDFNDDAIYNYLKSNNHGQKYCALSSIYDYIEKMEKVFLIVKANRYNIVGKEH